MDLGFAGKAVVVTGATANIGRAIALEMAKEGAKVLAVGRDRDAGARVVTDAKAQGAAAAEFVAVDLADADAERAGFVTGQLLTVDGGTLL